MDKNIYPTHTCFDDALELIGIWNSPERQPDLRLVHAICEAPTGERYAHAWVEDVRIGSAYFGGIYQGEKVTVVAKADEYRAGLNIQEVKVYSVSEAIRLNHETNHFGPWEERFRALCGRDRKLYGEVLGSDD